MDSADHHCFDRAELIYGISIQQAGAEVGWDAYAGFCRDLSVCTGANIFGCHNPRGGKDLRHLRPIQQAHGVRTYETVDENGISLRVDGKPYAALIYSNEKFYYVDENHEVTAVNKLMDSAIDDTEGGSTS